MMSWALRYLGGVIDCVLFCTLDMDCHSCYLTLNIIGLDEQMNP